MTKFGFFMIFETTTILIFEKWLNDPDQATTSDTSDK